MQHKHWSRLGVVVLSLAVSGPGATARADDAAKSVDPTGTYTWERRRRNDQTYKSTLVLKLDGHKVTGTYKGRRDEVKIENGKLDGNKLSFQITFSRPGNDRVFTMKYEGTVTAHGIKGTIAFGRDGSRSREWEAKRTAGPVDVTGLWKFKLERPNGEPIETSLKITRDGGKLKGLYKSPRRERQARNITLKGNVLSFELAGDTDDSDFRVVYKGKVSGNSIKGKLEFRFGDREGTMDFVGQREGKKSVDLARVVGTWKLVVTRDNGETSESTIAITKDGEKLKGLYTSRYGEREVKDVQLRGDVLSFQFSGETDNGDFLVAYKGKLSGDSFKGTMTFEFGDRKGSREFVGSRAKKKETL